MYLLLPNVQSPNGIAQARLKAITSPCHLISAESMKQHAKEGSYFKPENRERGTVIFLI